MIPSVGGSQVSPPPLNRTHHYVFSANTMEAQMGAITASALLGVIVVIREEATREASTSAFALRGPLDDERPAQIADRKAGGFTPTKPIAILKRRPRVFASDHEIITVLGNCA